jgi:hypothetical protein
VWAAVTVGLVLPTVAQARLFPYNYVYFNALATLKPINGNWATDYWRASGREITTLVPGKGEVSCIYIDAKHDFLPCADDATLGPFWADRGTHARPGTLEPGQYWLVRENNGELSMPAGCLLHDELTRPLRGQNVVIAQVMRCDRPQ